MMSITKSKQWRKSANINYIMMDTVKILHDKQDDRFHNKDIVTPSGSGTA